MSVPKIISLKQLAVITNSQIKGDQEIELQGVATLQDATEGQISFVSNPKYKALLKDSLASVVVLNPTLAEGYSGNALVNQDPYLTFAKVVSEFHKQERLPANIHPSAVIAADVVMGEQVNIAANVVIGAGVTLGDNVVIGANCVIGSGCEMDDAVYLYPNVTLYTRTCIGSHSIIHSGAVIGADGFGFAPNSQSADKSWYKIPQVGNVVLGSDVEVGANTTIDRAALGTTRIGNGVKLDNQIQVGHNVELGDHSIVAGGTVFAGSSVIGKRCQIGGTVAVAGHLKIVDDVIITGKSMVIKSISEAGVYSSGIAADTNSKWRRNAARFRKLDEMAKQLKQQEKRIQELEN